MSTKDALKANASYAKIRLDYQADAWLYGSTTTKEFSAIYTPIDCEKNQLDLDADFIVESHARLYVVSVDPAGEVGWSSNTYARPGCPTAHIIEVVLETTPRLYLQYCKDHQISYITAGKDQLDCTLLKEKLARYFGIQKLLICGGGQMDWTFMEQEELDAVSMVVAPVVSGQTGISTVFDQSPFTKNSRPVCLKLKQVHQVDEDILHLEYTVKNRGRR